MSVIAFKDPLDLPVVHHAMFLCRSTVSPSHVLSRSALRLFHRAADSAVSSRVVCRPRLDERPNFLSVQVSRRQFFSAASRDAGARFALRPPPRPAKRTKQPPPPEEEETMNYEVPMPEREPGSGLAKIFLAITIPIMLFSQADAIARFRVPPNEVREALNLDPNAKLSIAAYDYYIYHKKPDLVPWLEVAGFMKRNFSFVPANFVGNTPGEPARWWTLLTSEFNHGGLFHFFCCYTALKAFLPPLVQIYGSGVTAACFVVGGVMGHTFVGLYERTTNPFVKMSPAEIKKKAEAGFTKGEEKLHRDAYSWHLGSSSSLMTLGM